MILHQTFLHLRADRDMAGWHGSTGHVPRIHCWCSRRIQHTVPQCVGLTRDIWVLFICRPGLIDSVFLHPCLHRVTNISAMPRCCLCEVLLMVFFSRSLSYVMCMGCFSFLLLGGMYFVTDVKGWWAGRPFVYPGSVHTQIKSSLYFSGWYTLSL